MNSIKFSHKTYEKFKDGCNKVVWDKDVVFLVGLQKCKVKDLPKLFVEYDTCYWVDGEMKHYPLSLEAVVLVHFFFEPKSCHLFPTIRSWNAEKEKYRQGQLFQEFRVDMKEAST